MCGIFRINDTLLRLLSAPKESLVIEDMQAGQQTRHEVAASIGKLEG